MTWRITITLVCLVLAGCVQYSLVQPEQRKIGGVYTVDPQIAWSSLKHGKLELWTVDGAGLEVIRFGLGLAEGDVLIEPPGDKKMPKFRENMSANEIMEFVVDTLSGLGAAKVEASNLRPAKFGPKEGFRFDFSFVSPDGLDQLGFTVGAIIDARLHVIIYSGAKAHHFGKYKGHVERIIESIQI